MKILAIDTSTAPLSVAVSVDQEIVEQVGDVDMKSHSIKLLPLIDEVVQKAGWQSEDLDRVIVAQGPGSFTGIRIAVTTAKTLAWTLGTQLVGVSSLAVLARNVRDFTGYVVPFFDAHNGNVFAGVYHNNENNELVSTLEDAHVAMLDLLDNVQKLDQPVAFVGQGMDVYRNQILNICPNAKIIEDNVPQGQSLIDLGIKMPPIEDVDNFVPEYLRQTQAEMIWSQKQNAKVLNDSDFVQDV